MVEFFYLYYPRGQPVKNHYFLGLSGPLDGKRVERVAFVEKQAKISWSPVILGRLRSTSQEARGDA